MSKIVIKKRVSLDFLGDQYKNAYLVFQSIPLADYEKIYEDIPEEGKEGTKKSLTLITEYLDKYFVEGKFPNEKGELEDVVKEDLVGLDKTAAVTCFQRLTGQDVDPKSETPLSNPSSMEQDPQTNS